MLDFNYTASLNYWVSAKTFYSSCCQVLINILFIRCSTPETFSHWVGCINSPFLWIRSQCLVIVLGKLKAVKAGVQVFLRSFLYILCRFLLLCFWFFYFLGQPSSVSLNSFPLFLLLSLFSYLLLAPNWTLKLMNNFLLAKGWV